MTGSRLDPRLRPQSGSSGSLVPWCQSERLPVPHGRIGARARFAVGTIARQIEFAMLARHRVDVGVAPGVIEIGARLHIGAVPVLGACRLRLERRQAFLTCRIVTDIELVEIKR